MQQRALNGGLRCAHASHCIIIPGAADFLLSGLALLRAIGIADESIVPRLQFAGVAFAWGMLLLFALARPLERSWVLLPTWLVVAGVLIAIGIGYVTGVVSNTSATIAAIIGGGTYVSGFFGARFARSAAPT